MSMVFGAWDHAPSNSATKPGLSPPALSVYSSAMCPIIHFCGQLGKYRSQALERRNYITQKARVECCCTEPMKTQKRHFRWGTVAGLDFGRSPNGHFLYSVSSLPGEGLAVSESNVEDVRMVVTLGVKLGHSASVTGARAGTEFVWPRGPLFSAAPAPLSSRSLMAAPARRRLAEVNVCPPNPPRSAHRALRPGQRRLGAPGAPG